MVGKKLKYKDAGTPFHSKDRRHIESYVDQLKSKIDNLEKKINYFSSYLEAKGIIK